MVKLEVTLIGCYTLTMYFLQLIMSVFFVMQLFCYFDWLLHYPLLTWIKLLYFHGPTCNDSVYIGHAHDALWSYAFMQIPGVPYTTIRNLVFCCIFGVIGIIGIISSLKLIGNAHKFNVGVKIFWMAVIIANIFFDVVATVMFMTDVPYTQTLADIALFLGATLHGVGNIKIDTSFAAWAMVLLYSRFVIFFILNVMFLVIILIFYSRRYLEANEQAAGHDRNCIAMEDYVTPNVRRPSIAPDIEAVETPELRSCIENRTCNSSGKNKQSVQFPESLMSLPQLLENAIARSQRKLDKSIIDTSARYSFKEESEGTPSTTTAIVDFNSQGRRGTAVDLNSQLPWSYIPPQANRMRDQLPADEELPPIPVPDYILSLKYRKSWSTGAKRTRPKRTVQKVPSDLVLDSVLYDDWNFRDFDIWNNYAGRHRARTGNTTSSLQRAGSTDTKTTRTDRTFRKMPSDAVVYDAENSGAFGKRINYVGSCKERTINTTSSAHRAGPILAKTTQPNAAVQKMQSGSLTTDEWNFRDFDGGINYAGNYRGSTSNTTSSLQRAGSTDTKTTRTDRTFRKMPSDAVVYDAENSGAFGKRINYVGSCKERTINTTSSAHRAGPILAKTTQPNAAVQKMQSGSLTTDEWNFRDFDGGINYAGNYRGSTSNTTSSLQRAGSTDTKTTRTDRTFQKMPSDAVVSDDENFEGFGKRINYARNYKGRAINTTSSALGAGPTLAKTTKPNAAVQKMQSDSLTTDEWNFKEFDTEINFAENYRGRTSNTTSWAKTTQPNAAVQKMQPDSLPTDDANTRDFDRGINYAKSYRGRTSNLTSWRNWRTTDVLY